MNEQIPSSKPPESAPKITDGVDLNPKSNQDLAWDMAHAEKPYQDEALRKKTEAHEELERVRLGMSTDLTEAVVKSRNNDLQSLYPESPKLGDAENQVVGYAQYDQINALEKAQRLIGEIRLLKSLAEQASQTQADIYARLKNLEEQLNKV
jgi:hypothetical protein